MLVHTIRKALMQGPISLTRHRIDLISGLYAAASEFGQSEKTGM